jgi:hypothetical protein
VQLTSGNWTTLTHAVPALQNGLRCFGIQLDNGGGAIRTLYLDAINWSTASSGSSPSAAPAPTPPPRSSGTSSASGTPQPSGVPGELVARVR